MFARTLTQLSFLLAAAVCIGLPGPLLAASLSEYASGWRASPIGGSTPGVDWTPSDSSSNPLGAPNSNCVGTTNAPTVFAQFSFPSFGIPSGDTIVGIEVNVNYGSVVAPSMRLYKGSGVGSPVGSTRTLPATAATSTCAASVTTTAGGSADTWGASLTAADFNTAGEVEVRLTRTTAGPDNPVSIDIESVQMVVYHQGANSDPDCSGATISSPRNANASCQATISGADVSGVTDPDGDTPTITVNPMTLSLGANSVMINADDGNGGTCSKTVSVTVVDNTNPVVMCPSNVTLNANASCQATYGGPPATATDNCPGVSVSSSPSLPETFTGVGGNMITYTATDANGNMASCMQTVTLQDVTPPVIMLTGPSALTLECNVDGYTELGATVSDNCDAGLMAAIGGDTVDPSMKGTYTVTYDASDTSGNMATQVERTVEVQDTIPPVVTLNGPAMMTLECAVDTYVELGATAFDICDGVLPAPPVGMVDEGTPGTYEIDYTATDGEGLSDTKTRTVVVQDTLPPEITVSTDRFVLWPPNHKYHTIDLVDVVTDASDLCDLTLSASDVVLAEVSSDEPENANGDGNTVDDIVIAPVDCRSVDLRAERQGGGNGRVYGLDLEATDASDNVGTASSQVEVPHNKKGTAVDDGAAYSEVSDCASFKALMQCEGALDKAQFERLIDAKGACMAATR